jgi:hypothetical protein
MDHLLVSLSAVVHCYCRAIPSSEDNKIIWLFSLVMLTEWCNKEVLLVTPHSFCSLSYDKSIASSKASSPQGAIQCFLFKFPVSSRFLKVIQYLFTSSSSSYCHFYLSFSNMFYKLVPMQDVTNPVSLVWRTWPSCFQITTQDYYPVS